MFKIIIVWYTETNHWEDETWHTMKCIPYTKVDMLRVKKYVKRLNKVLEIFEYPKKQYDVACNKAGTNDVIEYLKKQKADINRQHESNEYRAGMTIKLYENGEMLPYEEWFKLPNFINHIKEIGETPPFYNRSN